MKNLPLPEIIADARPKVIAALLRYFKDLDFAEDAFQEACIRAIKKWETGDIPGTPVNWLITVGRNAGIDMLRRSKIQYSDALSDNIKDEKYSEDIYHLHIENEEFRDDILKLLFMCCHPELNAKDQLAIALKVVVGFPIEKISGAFLVSNSAMEKRMTRAKKKASLAPVELNVPSMQERMHRLSTVLSMLYLMFNEGYSAHGGEQHILEELCDEAIRLLRLLLELFPSQPEVMGALALCLLQHSRYKARIANDELVRLEDQDRALWDQAMISEGKVLVEQALQKGRPGAYQIQAAIAAVHASAKVANKTDWEEIYKLYNALADIQPGPVVELNSAVALSKISGAEAALSVLDGLAKQLSGYLYYHTTKAGLHEECGDLVEAVKCYQSALRLNPTTVEREYILKQLEALEK